jgi:hypothetical protein
MFMAQSIYETYKTDQKLEEDGIMYNVGTSKFRIAHAGPTNRKFSKLMQTLTKPYLRAIQTKTIDPELVEDLTREAYAKAIILGWENVPDESGKPLKYSVDNCIELMKKLPHLFAELQEVSKEQAVYRAVTVEAAAKN